MAVLYSDVNDNPDDDNIVYKQKIKDALLSNPALLYALHEKDLESELFDEDGNINWEFDEETNKYRPLGEWDRYFGGNSNIRPYLFIPDTQTDVKHYICYQVGFLLLFFNSISAKSAFNNSCTTIKSSHRRSSRTACGCFY